MDPVERQRLRDAAQYAKMAELGALRSLVGTTVEALRRAGSVTAAEAIEAQAAAYRERTEAAVAELLAANREGSA